MQFVKTVSTFTISPSLPAYNRLTVQGCTLLLQNYTAIENIFKDFNSSESVAFHQNCKGTVFMQFVRNMAYLKSNFGTISSSYLLGGC
jgi:hypothetical protein